MDRLVYFDNSATTYPKPDCVKKAVLNSMEKFGANPGRSGYSMAAESAQEIYGTRLEAASFFNADREENVIFCANCTLALNFVIKGLAKKGSHFVISNLEHNAVIRPLETLKNRGVCDYSIVETATDDNVTVSNFLKQVKDNTVAIICTGASNVFGKMLPLEKLGKAAHEKGVLFAVDAAQIAGVESVDVKKMNIDYLCVAAHKGLYAPMGIGMLIINCENELETLVQGGTGTQSAVFLQPDGMPERFESGTLSLPMISGLRAGMKFVKSYGVDNIRAKENRIVKSIYSALSQMKNVKLYTNPFSQEESFAPIISFNIGNYHSEEAGELLSRRNIALRAGYHCAYSAHLAYKTQDTGTLRISPSVFTTKNDVNLLLNSIFQIAKN